MPETSLSAPGAYRDSPCKKCSKFVDFQGTPSIRIMIYLSLDEGRGLAIVIPGRAMNMNRNQGLIM
jgi:hypothetical protein